MTKKTFINRSLIVGTLIIILVSFLGCTVGKSIKFDDYSLDSDILLDKIVVKAKIGGVIFDNKKVLNFDSAGGQYNFSDNSISGVTDNGENVILARDSIMNVLIRSYSQSNRSVGYAGFIKQQAVIDTLSGTNFNHFAPYLEVIKNQGKSAKIDPAKQIVNIKLNSGKYHQFSFDEIKFITIRKNRSMVSFIRNLSVVGIVVFVVVDNADNF